jgi:hypothetical protein
MAPMAMDDMNTGVACKRKVKGVANQKHFFFFYLLGKSSETMQVQTIFNHSSSSWGIQLYADILLFYH